MNRRVIKSHLDLHSTVRETSLTLIGKSWKTHPYSFHFPGRHTDRFTGKLIQFFFEISILGRHTGRFTGKLIHLKS